VANEGSENQTFVKIIKHCATFIIIIIIIIRNISSSINMRQSTVMPRFMMTLSFKTRSGIVCAAQKWPLS